MSPKRFTEDFTGAYATPELVGRADIQEQIKEIIATESQKLQVILLIGKGGYGKTRILQKVLSDLHEQTDLAVARDLIDLYHLDTHTPSGLADHIANRLTSSPDPFSSYQRERRELQRRHLSGEVHILGQQRKQVLEQFNHDIMNLSRKKRIVLTLDTAEKILYNFKHPIGQQVKNSEAWSWLYQAMPQWNNMVLIIAGRPEVENLYSELEMLPTVEVNSVYVDSFDLAETTSYFKAVQKLAHTEGRWREADRIGAMIPQIAHNIYGVTQGRPIYLSLLIDILITSDISPLDQIDSWEEYIIKRLIADNPDVGDTIYALGLLTKGATPELLATILDSNLETAHIRLEDIKKLSFIKVRRPDGRIFLHDELYELLDQHIYSSPEYAPELEESLQKVIEHYDSETEKCIEQMNLLYAPIEHGKKQWLDTSTLEEVHMQRRMLLIEVTHYRLAHNPVRGFLRYYRYMREGILSGDTLLDQELNAVLLEFWSRNDPEDQREDIDGLERRQIQGVTICRPVVQAWAEGRLADVILEAEKVRIKYSHLPEDSARATRAVLNTWEAYAHIYLGTADDFQKAYLLLINAIGNMLRYKQDIEGSTQQTSLRQWRASAILAFAYRVMGYWHRVQDSTHQAVANFRQAVQLWRQTNVLVELATTLNDLGFAMSELGYWNDGRAMVEEALILRRQLGLRSRVGLSMNTLAQIDVYAGNYESAIERANIALSLFRVLESERGTGLALTTLSEAKRRYSASNVIYDSSQKINLLREARDYAQDAIDIFEKRAEKSRLVQALIELGCTYRYWIDIRRADNSHTREISYLCIQGKKALEQAIAIVGDGLLTLQVDALINLAWLGFAAQDLKLQEDAIKRSWDAIPTEYLITPKTGKPIATKDEANISLWRRISKLCILNGHQKFSDYMMQQHNDFLEEAGYYYTLSLQYIDLYHHEEYRDRRRVIEEIYSNVRGLDMQERKVFGKAVEKTEREHNLGQSVLREILERRAIFL